MKKPSLREQVTKIIISDFMSGNNEYTVRDATSLADRIIAMVRAEAEVSKIEVRLNDDGSLDEVVGKGNVHLEQMDGQCWWLCVENGKEEVRIYLTSRAKIRTNHGVSGPVKVTPGEGG